MPRCALLPAAMPGCNPGIAFLNRYLTPTARAARPRFRCPAASPATCPGTAAPEPILCYPNGCMSGVVLDGKKISRYIQEELRPRIAELTAKHRPPALAVVLVGNDPASQIYVRSKIKACHDLGIRSVELTPDRDISTEELVQLIRPLAGDTSIDGILVQMPLPPQVNAEAVNACVDATRDVDGFGTFSLGRLVMNKPAPRACTPAGIMELLKRYQIPIAGKHAVVVG